MSIVIRQLGLVDYARGLDIQSVAAGEVRDGGLKGIVLVLRHPPAITMGRRTDPAEVHATGQELLDMGIELHRVDRGGGATWHYPGQAVVYPVISLSRTKMDVAGVISLLGDSVLDVLGRHGIEAEWDQKRPGAYVEGAKIASVGLHLSRDVITHGLALNVGPDLRGFSLMDPCKEAGLKVTCMASLIPGPLDPDEVGMELAQSFLRGLGHGSVKVARARDFH
ncbi:MAG: lipoyl(octanoyl) transferase LipB [Deltaproteobacteria bacterium]|nr:lipoyl(octanoyl) transferase LipB [Deltaproteobacteria bacterium]